MRVETRRDRGGLEPKSKRGRRRRGNRLRRTEDYAGARPFDTGNVNRHRHRQTQQTKIYVCICKQIDERSRRYNPRWARIGYKRTANRAANRCRCLFASTHTEREQGGGTAGRTRAFLEQREPPRNPAQKSYRARSRERSVRNQLGSTSSSPREMISSSSSSFFYSSRRSRSALNADLPYPALFDPPRYLIRP